MQRVRSARTAPSATAARAPRPAEPSPGKADRETAQARFEAAAALEARQPDQALQRYLELADGDGPWAANALFAAARLALDRGHEERAQSLLARYLKRFPQGANATDARALLERAP